MFSPHTRGCSEFLTTRLLGLQVFPAYAGMFLHTGSSASRTLGFPRIRGDVPRVSIRSRRSGRFSPHTRGCSGHAPAPPEHPPVFPAYAGMFLGTALSHQSPECFPRIHGDVPAYRWKARIPPAFSPHTRGYPASTGRQALSPQVFPAYAGISQRQGLQ